MFQGFRMSQTMERKHFFLNDVFQLIQEARSNRVDREVPSTNSGSKNRAPRKSQKKK